MSSYYEALPIFRAAMDQTVARFSKAHKYTIGARLREGAERTVIYVARANRL